ncbi:uncharacterized protein Dmoj_GI25775 [Drosophila mojavensis]|uniref:Uncharacterized protein n=1 Tax=Drosophila mojavensis TaxID=7230 RepID=A0A0Q9XN21_DROMO|nr:uncharacterized protein Dmoj_GI25775 [Drosophila mojavensis]
MTERIADSALHPFGTTCSSLTSSTASSSSSSSSLSP